MSYYIYFTNFGVQCNSPFTDVLSFPSKEQRRYLVPTTESIFTLMYFNAANLAKLAHL
jgi:hypothetical protein